MGNLISKLNFCYSSFQQLAMRRDRLVALKLPRKISDLELRLSTTLAVFKRGQWALGARQPSTGMSTGVCVIMYHYRHPTQSLLLSLVETNFCDNRLKAHLYYWPFSRLWKKSV